MAKDFDRFMKPVAEILFELFVTSSVSFSFLGDKIVDP
jgi:hypothetical protein